MLISDSHEFIFLRMRKVASTSMKAVLTPICLPRPAGRITHLKSRMQLEWNYQKYVFRAHDPIRTAQRLMPPDKFERYFKFAFVRNPWDRMVSEYEFLLKRPQHHRHARVKKLSGFRQFIEMQIPRKDAYQVNMLCDSKGQMRMDFIGKMENLNDDWLKVCERIGLEPVALPSRKVNPHRHYTEYYDDESRRLVSRHWAREIELFDYQFD